MWLLRHRRGISVPLADDRADALRLFRWYLSECAIDHLRRYRLVSEETGETITGDALGVQPFYARDSEAGL